MGVELQSKKRKVDVIILMAGEGRRMRPYTVDRPKALVRCEDGVSIFNHILNSFQLAEYHANFLPVVGHGAKKVYEEVSKIDDNDKIKCIFNPFYNSAGPLVSVWLGLLQSTADDVVIVNGDTLITSQLTKSLANWSNKCQVNKPAVGLCVSLPKIFEDDDMKVVLNNEGDFIQVGKKVIPDEKSFVSTGVFYAKGLETKENILSKISQLFMENKAVKKDYHWHNIINEIKDETFVDLIEVSKDCWHEMDTPAELDIINAL